MLPWAASKRNVAIRAWSLQRWTAEYHGFATLSCVVPSVLVGCQVGRSTTLLPGPNSPIALPAYDLGYCAYSGIANTVGTQRYIPPHPIINHPPSTTQGTSS